MKKTNKTIKPAAKCDKCSAPVSVEFRVEALEKRLLFELDAIRTLNEQIGDSNKNIIKIEGDICSLQGARRDTEYAFSRTTLAFVVIYLAVILLALCVIRF